MQSDDLTTEKSSTSVAENGSGRALPAWIKVGAVAAASALAGGLAAAWYYRKTLQKLQQADSEVPDFGISGEHTDQDT